jgi:quinoprotein glucose dehydrogenase
MRRLARLATAATIVAYLLALAFPAAAVDARRVVGGLDQPVAFTFDRAGRIWYVEKDGGEVRVVDPSTDRDSMFVHVDGVSDQGERGLLGIALHPRYPTKPFVYVFATRTANGALRNQVVRFRDRNGAGVDQTVIFSSRASDSPYHNGGHIAFGPDGNLYVVVGEGHSPALAQDRRDDRGKILRVEPNGDVPRTNPFDNRVWAYGIRNSFGFGFDPETGRLWETENGPSCNDEINLIKRGRNYGWGPNQTCQGSAPRNTNQDGPRPVLPEVLYEEPIAVTGIAFCDGCNLGARSEGAAFHGAANDGRIARLLLTAHRTGVRTRSIVYDHAGSTLSVEAGPGGRLYFSDFDSIFVLTR